MRMAVVGDVHGRADRLGSLLHRLGRVDRIVCVGDYVDKGPDPIGVLEQLAQLPHAICLVGNHELKLLKRRKSLGFLALPEHVAIADAEAFWEAMDRCLGPDHRYYYRDDEVLVTHAPSYLWQHSPIAYKISHLCYGFTSSELEPGTPYRRRKPLSEIYPDSISERPVIYGHIHSDRVEMGPNTYCVDLNAESPHGRLAALILDHGCVVDTVTDD